MAKAHVSSITASDFWEPRSVMGKIFVSYFTHQYLRFSLFHRIHIEISFSISHLSSSCVVRRLSCVQEREREGERECGGMKEKPTSGGLRVNEGRVKLDKVEKTYCYPH